VNPKVENDERVVFKPLTHLKSGQSNRDSGLSNYEAGRRLEYRVRDLFRRSGFFVIRAAQSKPVDLVCLRNGKSILVECKAGRSFLGKERKRELLDLGQQAGATVVLARRKRRKVELTNLGDGRSLELEKLNDL
jgi:Holliday junction resolvase